jgi:cytoskeletal protein RodZ
MARKSRKLFRTPVLAAIAVILLLVLIIVFALRQPNKGSGVIPSSSPKSSARASDKQPGPSDTPSAVSDKSGSSSSNTSQPAAGLTLLAPSGTFVSNHHPNLGGSPAPTAEQSVCNTTQGASCYIKFTKGDITKTLASQVVDNTGSTYWSWDVKASGFTEGSWQITAIASLNSQTKSTADSQALTIQP